MRILFPLAILLSVAWLLLVSILASRGGGSGAGPTSPQAGDAAGLLRQSQEAMLELDSFQAEMTTSWEGREDTYRVAWQSPDSFHVLSPYVVAHYESGQETEITDYGFVEAIAIGDRMYTRQCVEEDEDCQPWQEGPRDNVYLPAAVPEQEPMWTIELLGLMSDAEIVGQEDVEGVACTRIRGRANILRAMVQSWRSAEESWGPMNWGEECTAEATELGSETQEECHTTTLDEYIAMHEDSVRQQDENLGSVEVWIGRDDKLMRRLEFPLVADQPAGGYFALSQFNEVTVQPPK